MQLIPLIFFKSLQKNRYTGYGTYEIPFNVLGVPLVVNLTIWIESVMAVDLSAMVGTNYSNFWIKEFVIKHQGSILFHYVFNYIDKISTKKGKFPF